MARELETPEPHDRLYEDGDGWYADPLVQSWIHFDKQVLERLMSPMHQRPHDHTIHDKVQVLLSKHTRIQKEMFELLNQLNHLDFASQELKKMRVF